MIAPVQSDARARVLLDGLAARALRYKPAVRLRRRTRPPRAQAAGTPPECVARRDLPHGQPAVRSWAHPRVCGNEVTAWVALDGQCRWTAAGSVI
jgi:hypothetical protein